MVHWVTNDSAHRRVQVKVAVEYFKENMKRYASAYNLDGYSANVCQVVCDIRHQRRASNQQIITALNTSGNFEAAYTKLLQIGQPLYVSRIATVRSVIKKFTDSKLFNKNIQSVEE